ncbi:MAG: ATP-binding protein [Acidobacteriota bacterium]|nr:ATP-binding protein [Acidobacteriota bacterium]
MSPELGPTGTLVKVRALGEDGRVYFDLRDGKTGSFFPADKEYRVGDVLLIHGEIEGDVRIEKVPDTTWPDERWVGVVKIKLQDTTVVEAGGRFRAVPSVPEPDYDVGYTVHGDDTNGVVRVFSKRPIRLLELPEVDDSVISRFHVEGEAGLDFDHFGGLDAIVARARELIEVPLKSGGALSTIGVRAVRGVLFTGPPGTGKTLLARIVASQAEAAFYEISGPEIFSKWYGQSEELLRKIFQDAASKEKALVFFDEIDSIAAQRDDQSHEVSKRVVAQLLTLMDGFSSTENIVVIAATNRPQDLDAALRRPGRFDWEIEFPYPNEVDRRDILEKTAQRVRTCGLLPHGVVAARSDGWSAAELTQIWTEAALLAVADDRDEICDEDYVGGFERVSRYREEAGRAPRSAPAR